MDAGATVAPPRGTRRVLGFEWPQQVSEAERRSLVAGGLGWMLDAMDVMLYSLVLAHLMRDLGMDKTTAGLLNSLTLLASAIGGLLFGFLADRVGRTRALMVSILVYSLASGACGLSTTIVELAVLRFVLGLGMGGEWTTGAALIAETWPAEHRGKALGLMQSTWALGEMIAAGVVAVVLPSLGWRAVFFVGVLPALIVFWIRRDVPEPGIWLRQQESGSRGSLRLLWRKDLRRNGLLATAMNACGMFGYWGLFTWIPAYLSLPIAEGGRGLDLTKTTAWLVLMGVGKWLGYALFGFFADSVGRRRSYVAYLLAAAALVPFYGRADRPLTLLLLGPFVAFFGSGFFSGFSALASELFPTEIRATAMGLSYNVGRGLSAAAPALVGLLASRFGLGSAFFLQAAAFLAAALLALALPETKGKELNETPVLNAVDFAVIGGYLIAITLFGSWFARFQKTTKDYFLTGRTVPWWAICFTIVATETSTLTFIGVPALAYGGNLTFLQLALGYVVGRLLVSVLFIPAYFRGDLFTSYELLQRRFGAPVKTTGAVIFLVTRSLADGIRLFATALVIAVVTRVPVTVTVVVLGLAMIVYTVRGGVSAVIWTDVVQMFVYLAGALVVLVALLSRVPGGAAAVVSSAAVANKLVLLDFSTDPHVVYTFWAGLVGGLALTLATHGTDQYLVQRLLSARSARQASAGLVLSGVIVFAQFALFLFIGLSLFAFYQGSPPTLSRNDEILPFFIVNSLVGGPAGFIVAAIVAAALSPSLNAMAATTVNDFYRPYLDPGADEATLMRVSRRATIAWGVVQLAVALGAQWMNRSVLDAGLAVLSLASGPVLGAFVLGVLSTRVDGKATMLGMVTGAAVLLGLWAKGSVAWTWYAFVGASVTISVALLAAGAGRAHRAG